MLDNVPWQALTGAGAGWALAGFAVWAIITGRLVPRTTHEEVIHDRNEWRAESRIKDQQLLEKDIQLRHMGEVGQTVNTIMRSLGAAVDREAS
ncbi:hypothetical protein ASE01_20130 [Nocardioides sp. Root190]|uniref:hypothetical protein n=1 Tax=Nocardioides sp. Root190 TaxID=1736488 RepID=UPI0006F58C9E|nr:hypothetical protein [Nocardioides sp. Root190]KRB73086.1 hypothetical protein ASE01_20130 [Nocardioides sp. Root190]